VLTGTAGYGSMVVDGEAASLTPPANKKQKFRNLRHKQMAKLSKANKDTLEILKKGLAGKEGLPDDLMQLLEKTIIDIKEDASSSRERKPRSISNIFSPTAAKIFRMRIVDGKSQPDVEKELDLEAQKVASGVREVGYKLVAHLLKDENIGEAVSKAVDELLVKYATGKERGSKDDTVETPSADGATEGEGDSTDADAEVGEEPGTEPDDDELAALLAAE